MCEIENKNVIPDGYVTMGTIVVYLNKIFGRYFSKDDIPYLHRLFQSTENIQYKKLTRPGYDRPIVFYNGKPFRNMAEDPKKYSYLINSLSHLLFRDIVDQMPNNPPIQKPKREKQETPWNETNMDFVNQELLNKYQND